MAKTRFCKTCGETGAYRLLENRDAWVCLWDLTVTTGYEAANLAPDFKGHDVKGT